MTQLAVDPMAWLPTSDTPLLEAALAYAAHGFRVLPVWWIREGDRCACGRPSCHGLDSSAGKHPIGAKWQLRATSDADAVREAFRKYPHANIGIAMGGKERLVAVDVDGEQGRASWEELVTNVAPVPSTLTDRSGRPDGGEHRIFHVAPHLDIARLGNRSSARKMGIDTRTDNGQVVVAPSTHVSGSKYAWTVRAPVAQMPEWLFEALASPIELGRSRAFSAPAPAAVPPPSSPPAKGRVVDFARPYIRKVIENAAKNIAAAKPGQRNSLLYAKACTVFEYHVGEGLDHQEAWRTLGAAGVSCGLKDAEIFATLSKAWAQAQKQPRRVPPSRPQHAPPAPPQGTETNGGGSGGGGGSGEDDSWKAKLATTKEGYVKNTFGNICKLLRHAPEYRGRFSYNEMRVTPFVDARPMRDNDIGQIREDLEGKWEISPAKEPILEAIKLVASERSFHPVQSYLGGLVWDQQPRIERVAAEVLGNANADALELRMLRCWFISAVARALTPGCKVDTTLVLVGETGFKKSTFFAELGGEWFSNSYADVRSKDGILQVHAAWIYEWAEIERITTRTHSGDVKAFLTIARDDLRPPYGLGVISQPRSSVIVGTTNRPFLDDETGSRRFHPVTVHKRVDVAKLRAWRDQLWAEAVVAFRGGEEWWLSESDERARESAADEHTVENPWLERVAAYLRHPGHVQNGVSIADVLVNSLGLELGRVRHEEVSKVGKALRQLGWVPKQETRGATRVRIYRPRAQPPVAAVQGCAPVSPSISTSSHPAHPTQPVLNDSGQNNSTSSTVSPSESLEGRAGCAAVQPASEEPSSETFAGWLEGQGITNDSEPK